MAMKKAGRKIYKSANGKSVDLDLLIARNELTPAVGNVRVNARGDELGPGGKIIRKKEDALDNYYNTSSDVKSEVVNKEVRNTPAVSADTAQWEEDNEGNFVKSSEVTSKTTKPMPKTTTRKSKI